MMDFLKSVVVAATVLSASVAHAGGPVIIEEGNGEEIAEKPASSVGILPILGALVLVGLLVGAGGSDEVVPVPEKCPGGCD